MKKLFLLLLLLSLCSPLIYGEVDIKYNGKLCKMEIIDNTSMQSKYSKDKVQNEVLKFCKDKYIYNISLTVDKYNNHIYIVFYNDKN